jgi:hypothetical protein
MIRPEPIIYTGEDSQMRETIRNLNTYIERLVAALNDHEERGY